MKSTAVASEKRESRRLFWFPMRQTWSNKGYILDLKRSWQGIIVFVPEWVVAKIRMRVHCDLKNGDCWMRELPKMTLMRILLLSTLLVVIVNGADESKQEAVTSNNYPVKIVSISVVSHWHHRVELLPCVTFSDTDWFRTRWSGQVCNSHHLL